MQSQMIGMQSSLDRILSAVQTPSLPPSQSMYPPLPPRETAFPSSRPDHYPSPRRQFPPLPGFAAPVCHLFISFSPSHSFDSRTNMLLMESSQARPLHPMTSPKRLFPGPLSMHPSRPFRASQMPLLKLPMPLPLLQGKYGLHRVILSFNIPLGFANAKR